MEKTKKIDKDFILSDSSVNVYNYRLLTEGYQLAEYQKNPIGYYMHREAEGILVRWEDLRVEGDQVLGKPVINLSHPRGQQTADEIEHGFLNGASMGDTVVLAYTYEPNAAAPEEPILVVTEWYNKECSLVDKPGNRNSFVRALTDRSAQPIAGAGQPQSTSSTASIRLGQRLQEILQLQDHADEGQVTAAIARLASQKAQAESRLADLLDQHRREQVQYLVDQALDKGKLTRALGDQLARDYARNPEGLARLLQQMPAYTPLADKLQTAATQGKTWNELHASGALAELKRSNPALFRQLYEAEHGTAYEE